jgi:hypothetical protein
MVEVKIPAEIRAYKSKVIAGLTARQIFAVGGALAVGVPLGVFGRNFIPPDILPWFVIVSVAPFAGWGFMTYKGMNFEEYLKALYNFYFLPQKRAYEDTGVNVFSFLKSEIVCSDITKQRVENGEIDEDDVENEYDDLKWEG